MKTRSPLYLILIVFCACNKECEVPGEIKKIDVRFDVVRMEDRMSVINTFDEAIGFLDEEATFSEWYLERDKFPDDTLLARQILTLNNDKSIDTLRAGVKKAFPDFHLQYHHGFTGLFQGIRFYFNDFKPPHIYTAITGFGTDVFYFDTMLVISLDYFAWDSTGFKPDLPFYMLHRYGPEYIVPMAALAVSERYNKSDLLDRSLIAEMIYYGKAYYFMEKVLPCTHDSLIIGYSGEELRLARLYQKNIWAHFIDANVLFETKNPIVSKYVGERPFTGEVSPKCPGRIGRWIGWQIVRKYMEMNPEVGLADLMADKDARKIFEATKYKP